MSIARDSPRLHEWPPDDAFVVDKGRTLLSNMGAYEAGYGFADLIFADGFN